MARVGATKPLLGPMIQMQFGLACKGLVKTGPIFWAMLDSPAHSRKGRSQPNGLQSKSLHLIAPPAAVHAQFAPLEVTPPIKV